MKQRILQVITSVLLIMTLTMANVLLLCANAISYAVEEASVNKSTNHKNVEFMAYFKDEKGNKVTEMNTYTDSNDLRLYFQVSVKQEGYFNGNIVLNDANFKFKTDILSDAISKIENNVIYLNQIKAGDSKEVEVGIELIKDEQFDLNLISMESKISVEGIYRDSTDKDISIKAQRNVTLNFVSPYTSAEESIVLSQNIITNKILKFNGEDKRVIQIQVKSGLNNNLFPVSKSSIKIQAPKISDKYPEEVLVNSNSALTTNGKKLLQDNWNYNEETGLINVNVENKEENNKVSWIKTGDDEFIVTYIYDKDVEMNNEKTYIESKIELYDLKNTSMGASSEISLDETEKDSIITTNIIQSESSIYKGKLYAGISRDITYKNNIDVNLINVASEINIKEDKQTINDKVVNSTYKTSKINKANLEEILGENGSLSIIDAETGNVITTINKDVQENENGDIVVAYPENVTTITLRLIAPEKIGRLEIETTKSINVINKDLVKNTDNIEQKISAYYVSDNKENVLEGTSSKIDLKETETSVDLEISRTELSAMTANNNVEFRITLKSKEEKNELFKNPVLRLELPEKIQDIKINSVKLVYEDEMKIKKYTLNNKTLEIVLDGEQTKYKEEAIDGAMIIVDANLTTSTKIPSSTEKINLTYSNDKAINYKDGNNIGNITKDINIVSYAGVVTINQIAEYGIEVVNNEGTKNAKLAVSSDTKNVTIEKKIINNKENKISDVKILGVFPTKEAFASNNIDVQVGSISLSGVDATRTKTYYSSNANATEDLDDKNNGWTEQLDNLQNVKKYLVVIDELDVSEEVDLTYQITIPANLEYNETAEEGYNVYYEDTATSVVENTKLDNVRLSTGEGPAVNTSLKAFVGSEEASTVKEGEFISYVITASNTGSEDITDLKLVGKVPENTVYVEKNERQTIYNSNGEDEYEPFIEKEDVKEVEFTVEKLTVGETVTKAYQVKVKDNTDGKTASNSITTKYGEVSKTSNEVSYNIKKGEIQTVVYSVDNDGMLKCGYQYRYVVKITNKSDKEKKNIKVNANVGENLDLVEIYYITEDNKVVSEKENSYINIESIEAGKTIEVTMLVKAKTFTDKEQLDDRVIANVNDGDETYNSNVDDVVIKAINVETTITSNNSSESVKAGDIIEYSIIVKNNGNIQINDMTIQDVISNKTTLSEITKNGEKLSQDAYLIEHDGETGEEIIKISDQLDSDEQNEYKIKVVVNRIPGNKESVEIINNASITVDGVDVNNKNITHILTPESTENPSDDDSGNNGGNSGDSGDNSGDNGDNSGDNQNKDTKSIFGTVWIDENENGNKDSGEELLKGVTVRLLDVKTNTFVKDSNGKEMTATTNENGFYSFDKISSGEYIVIFEYDTSKYVLTQYDKNEENRKDNSKVINKTMSINGTEKTVGATEVIKVSNENISNINMGLRMAKKSDLKLDKYVSKIIIQNSKGTVTNEYNNAVYAKAEIDAKLLNSTTAVVEYTIKITNVGEVDEYARKIADYISKDYKFTSQLNKDWYQSGDVLYNTSLSDEKIKPGESKELKLVVTKQMTENNTGLINNTAKIVESYNDLGLKDNNDNNSNSANLTLSIKTGQVVTTVTLILSTIIIIGTATYIIGKFVLNKRII